MATAKAGYPMVNLPMSGILYGVGVGPGDPELLTLKAHRLISNARVIAWMAPNNQGSFAHRICAELIANDATQIAIEMPITSDRQPAASAYDAAANRVIPYLAAGKDLVVLCEGDPFFYGSFIYLHRRIAAKFPVVVVPGICSLNACAAAVARPLCARDDQLHIIPATANEEDLRAAMQKTTSIAIVKLGRHFGKVRSLIEELGLNEQALFIEQATLADQQSMPLAEAPEEATYFSMILIYRGKEIWR